MIFMLFNNFIAISSPLSYEIYAGGLEKRQFHRNRLRLTWFGRFWNSDFLFQQTMERRKWAAETMDNSSKRKFSLDSKVSSSRKCNSWLISWLKGRGGELRAQRRTCSRKTPHAVTESEISPPPGIREWKFNNFQPHSQKVIYLSEIRVIFAPFYSLG